MINVYDNQTYISVASWATYVQGPWIDTSRMGILVASMYWSNSSADPDHYVSMWGGNSDGQANGICPIIPTLVRGSAPTISDERVMLSLTSGGSASIVYKDLPKWVCLYFHPHSDVGPGTFDMQVFGW